MKVSARRARVGRRSVLAAVLMAGTALAAPAAQAAPEPVPDLVCRLDAELDFTPSLGVLVKEARVTGHVRYLDCRSPSGAAPHLTDVVWDIEGIGRFGALPPTFSVEGKDVGTWNTGEAGSLYYKGDLKNGSPVPDRTITSGPLAGDQINGIQIPRPRFDKINPDGVAGFDVFGQVCIWPGERGRCTAY
ncbi:hypothetical protein C4B68_04455 [Streptomyces dengpaensis]|uniref:Uncharacterized protein n=1 Tax=Streptomyces dengpaensis TaxID=2049881 RepID=A0ABM6SKR0_9ACTN|nr:hypothetical protein C4B68_04455 [Streptomyces dengpaensis]PIB07456.1 hypothetical protein B1C81_20365 [Streptomyces sp. HG99]